MKHLLLTGAMLALTALPSFGQTQTPLQDGQSINVRGTYLCDTADQIADIVEARRISLEASEQKYNQFFQLKNSQGESSCDKLYNPVPMRIVGTVGEILGVPSGDTTRDFFIVAVFWQHVNGGESSGFIVVNQRTVKAGVSS